MTDDAQHTIAPTPPSDWLMTEKWHCLRIQVAPSGISESANICGRCGAIVFFDHMDLHDDFHGRAPFDPMNGNPPDDMPPPARC